jgi:Xaa-Pro aminopeptidase
MRIAPADCFQARLSSLQLALSDAGLDGLVVTSLPNIAYLTGFFASAGAAVVARDEVCVVGDGRYASVLTERVEAFAALKHRVIDAGWSYDEAIVDTLTPLVGARIGFEAAHVSVERHRSLTARLERIPGWADGLRATTDIIETLRLRKDSWEVARLRDGAARLSDVAKCILPKVLAGRTESDVAGEIEWAMRRVGFERPAFDTIVAAGPHAALPHARASTRHIEPGELVVIDFGGMLDGYCTDLTRTVVAGAGDSAGAVRERRLIEQVVEAQLAAFRALKPGEQPEVADQAARNTLADHGLAEAFTHGTGHGLGLEIHEGPRVTRARAGRAEPVLAPGMILTLEPGVYFPGWGGVRIEDDVLVTESGAEWLTDVPRTL